MKTLFIVVYDITLLGGAEKVALNLANDLSNTQNIVVVSVFHVNPNPIVKLNDAIKVEVLSDKPLSMSLNLFKLSIRLRKLIKKYKASNILGITAGSNTIVKIASLFTATNIIYAEHSNLLNDQYGFKHKFRQFLGAKTFDKVVTLTDADSQVFKEKFKLCDSKVTRIYNYVEAPNLLTEYKAGSKIVSVGRLAVIKGYDRAIQVASILKQQGILFSWDVYGDGPEKEHLEKLIEESGLKGVFNLKGAIDDVNTVLGEYSLFINTSTYEGLPLSFLEARNHKLPIVSFDCPTGPKEIVRSGIDGKLITPYSIDEMVSNVRILITTPELLIDYSNAISNSDDKFKKEQVLQQWRNLLEGKNL